MQKLKRILALITAAGLLLLYLVTFYVGVFGKGDIRGLLTACIVLTVLVPVLFYAMFLVAGIMKDHGSRVPDNDVPGNAPSDSAGASDNANAQDNDDER